MIYIAGLGNPGEEYVKSRHNTGRIVLEHFAKQNNFSEFEVDKKSKSLISKGEVGGEKITLILPETFMNKSGGALAYFVKPATGVGKNKKPINNLVVVYDDMDLALGDIKISFGKSSGGHNGLESIIKSLKTKDFARLRIGISPSTIKGKVKKPTGEDKVLDFILGKFKPSEEVVLKKVINTSNTALISIISDGREKAMNLFN